MVNLYTELVLSNLEKIDELIVAFLRHHYASTRKAVCGFIGYKRDVADLLFVGWNC